MARKIEIAAWALSIVLQWAILMRSGWKLPAFSVFLLYDWLRWSSIFLIWFNNKRTLYGIVFSWTEPGDFVLLGLTAIEAGSAIAPRGAALFPVALAACLVITRALPDAVHVPLGGMLLARTMVTASICAALIVTGAWCKRFTWHAGILLAFCLIDLTSYLAILLGAKPWTPDCVIMVGQTCCLGAWLTVAIYKFRGKLPLWRL